jgi:hypothetical protein
MATINGSANNDRIDGSGVYVWNGSTWVLVSAKGTTSHGDTVYGGGGNDIIDGLAGNDKLYGQDGNDVLIGGAGADLLDGGLGDDTLYGGTAGPNATNSGADDLRGGAGNDTLYGGDGNDKLQGNEDNDFLYGEDGADTLDGGSGSDILNGGLGADILTGGEGADYFVFNAVSESQATSSGAYSSTTGDTISDFVSMADSAILSQQDKIDLRGLSAAIGKTLVWGGTTPISFGVWYTVASGVTYVNVDTTGDQKADMVIRLSSVETLVVGDFLGVVESSAPTVISVAYGQNDGTLKESETVTLAVTFSKAVLVSGGIPSVALSSGGSGTYVSGSGTTTLLFSYTVASGQNTPDLAITAFNLKAATIRDSTGNDANVAGAITNPSGILAVDTVAPAAPGVSLNLDSGLSASDKITNNGSLKLTGLESGASVQYSTDGGTSWKGSFVAVEGPNSVLARQLDAAGNPSAASSFAFTLDTVAPSSPGVALSNDSGTSASDKITNDGSLSLAGIEGGALVQYSTNNGTSWSSFFAAVQGVNAILVRQMDVAGNAAIATSFTFTLDTIAPLAPVASLEQTSDTGASNTDHITNDNTPTLAGTAESNAAITIFDGATAISQATADGAGNWSITVDSLDDRTHGFTFTATDKAGNVSPLSAILAVTIDTLAPPAPTIDLDAASDTGASNTDNITGDTTPTLVGTASAGDVVKLYDGATLLGQSTADQNGTWSITTAVLAAGLHNFSATATDIAGNTSAASSVLGVYIESTAPPPVHYTIDTRVSAGSDDGEESRSTGGVYINSSDLELINDIDYWGLQTVGVRFTKLGIPEGAVITAAWIQFTVDETDFDPTNLTINAQLSSAAATFASANFNISSRTLTAGTIAWSPDAWNLVGASGLAQRTPDLSSLIQEVVALPNWTTSSAIAFIFGGTGKRTATSYESGASTAPLLHVEYTIGGTNVAPVANPDSATTAEDTPVTIAVLANDTDADGNTLMIAALGKAAHGATILNGNGTVTYAPDMNYHGPDGFSYTVSDGNGGVSTTTVSVTVTSVNDPPVAINDLATTPAGSPVVLDLLANDRDPDGDSLSIGATTAPGHGSVALTQDGKILYTPIAGFTGIDSFTYTAIDGHGGSDTASVEVHVGVGFGTATFAVIGDYGVNNGYESAVSQLVKHLNPQFVVTVGDNTYGTQNSIDTAIGQYYSSFIGNYQGAYGTGSASNRFFPSLGNHDWSDSGLATYENYFTLPESTSGNERYYDFVMGPVQFFVIDSDSREPDGITPDSVQGQWLKTQLANSVTPWQVVVMHESPYSSGSEHGPNPTLQWPFEDWGADAILSGHDHDYERLLKDDNHDGKIVPYFVDGAGGAGLYSFSNNVDPDSAFRYNADHGALLMTATDTELHFEFWSTVNGGTLIDSYSILV